MNTTQRKTVWTIAVLTGLVWQVQAIAAPEVGKQLTPAEISALGGKATHKLGERTLVELPASASPAQTTTTQTTQASAAKLSTTMVVNESGVVGLSRNEVLIARMPTREVRSKLGALAGSAVSVQYFDHTDITSLRFATLAQAVAAREKLLALLPEAQIILPVEFSKPGLR